MTAAPTPRQRIRAIASIKARHAQRREQQPVNVDWDEAIARLRDILDNGGKKPAQIDAKRSGTQSHALAPERPPAFESSPGAGQ